MTEKDTTTNTTAEHGEHDVFWVIKIRRARRGPSSCPSWCLLCL
jgi:hypothetical protein